ncbi:MAG: cytochrome c [candidate division NC10 bacterium]|nr:cytochrome c [candidate division NC10 bacterium]
MIRIARSAALILAALVVVGAAVFFVATRPPQLPVNGRELYVRYCASCHGMGGRGDGPASKAFRRRPSDLTRVRARYAGQYPIREVMAAIDGRYPVRAHGDSAMPVWGIVFEQEKEEKEARWPKRTTLLQVRLIADYVLTLQ